MAGEGPKDQMAIHDVFLHLQMPGGIICLQNKMDDPIKSLFILNNNILLYLMYRRQVLQTWWAMTTGFHIGKII